jgi:hypothetical protein
MDEYFNYRSTQVRNREIFQKNFDSDIREFKALLARLRSTWARVGNTRGILGHAHTGLLLCSNILIRHVIFGFEHLACYQSFLAWLAFRPGPEALLIIGKFVDDLANARIWLNREVDAKTYQNTSRGNALQSKSLARSAEFPQHFYRVKNSSYL